MALPAPLKATVLQQTLHSILYVYHVTAPDTPPPLIDLSDHSNISITFGSSDQILKGRISQRSDIVFIDRSCLSDPTRYTQLIAHCRDLLASRVMLARPLEKNVKDRIEPDLLALAFQRCAVTEETDNDLTAYYLFDLKHYKPVPDWLNPRFWANPQLWDQHRW